MRTKDLIEEVIWESLMKKATPYKSKPNIGTVANDVIELLAVQHAEWRQYPDWCRDTNNATYKCIYKKIHNKFHNNMDFVNEEIGRRRNLALEQSRSAFDPADDVQS